MKIGYPCINNGLITRAQRTFRLASFTEERFHQTVEMNIHGLEEILIYNKENNLLFLRIGSGLIPFASHEICTVDWQKHYATEFKRLGEIITKNYMRISMHPDQFTLINSVDEKIFERTVAELVYHEEVLSLLGLDMTAKIQIHVGGVYGDKEESIRRFISRFHSLPEAIKKRLVIEDDDRLYSIKDCLTISEATGIPILFDSLHHEILNNGETMREGIVLASQTWMNHDGIPMIDYSQQEPGARVGNHAQTINKEQFKKFLESTDGLDFDIMFEIKDKEISAIKAKTIII